MKRLLCAVALLAIGVSGCATTSLISTWKEPGAGPLTFKKILVFAPGKDIALRRSIEDELVRQIKGTQAIASYTLLPEGMNATDAAVHDCIRGEGFDGVVVLRIVSTEKEATWVPGAWTGAYYAYGGWPTYDPGYVQVDTFVRVETNVYAVPDQRLVWASASRTVNPTSIRGLVDSTVRAVGKEMRKQGLITALPR